MNEYKSTREKEKEKENIYHPKVQSRKALRKDRKVRNCSCGDGCTCLETYIEKTTLGTQNVRSFQCQDFRIYLEELRTCRKALRRELVLTLPYKRSLTQQPKEALGRA